MEELESKLLLVLEAEGEILRCCRRLLRTAKGNNIELLSAILLFHAYYYDLLDQQLTILE